MWCGLGFLIGPTCISQWLSVRRWKEGRCWRQRRAISLCRFPTSRQSPQSSALQGLASAQREALQLRMSAFWTSAWKCRTALLVRICWTFRQVHRSLLPRYFWEIWACLLPRSSYLRSIRRDLATLNSRHSGRVSANRCFVCHYWSFRDWEKFYRRLVWLYCRVWDSKCTEIPYWNKVHYTSLPDRCSAYNTSTEFVHFLLSLS